MHYSGPVLYEPEFNNFDSYYLTWYDSSYSSDGPYGEPLQYTREGLVNESNSVYEEVGDGFLSGSWYSENKLTDQVFGTTGFPYDGGSSWVDEYGSYFASCWGEDTVPCGYGDREYEDYSGSLERAEHTNEGENQEGSYSSLSDSMEGADFVNPWFGYHFEFADGVEDSYSLPGKPNQPPADNNEDPWGYIGLWESIFGYWPCLQRLDEERPPDLLLTYSH